MRVLDTCPDSHTPNATAQKHSYKLVPNGEGALHEVAVTCRASPLQTPWQHYRLSWSDIVAPCPSCLLPQIPRLRFKRLEELIRDTQAHKAYNPVAAHEAIKFAAPPAAAREGGSVSSKDTGAAALQVGQVLRCMYMNCI